ncbi:MAG: hypothetical protein ACE5KW_03280 [Dehalococcoidia bacterium]
MKKFLFCGTHASDDPTRAAFPFIAANATVEAGHQPTLCLALDGVLLLKEAIAESVMPVGFPPFKEHLAKAIENKTPILV